MAAVLNLYVTPVAGSQSIADNTSKVDITLTITTNGGTHNLSGDTSGYISVDGTQVANLNAADVREDTTTTLYSGRHSVQHNADGKKTAVVKAAFDVNTNTRWIYAETSVTLPTIPRASALSFGNIIISEPTTIAITKYVDTHQSEITYTFGGRSGSVTSKTGATSVMWTPPYALGYEVPADKTSYGGAFTVKTYDQNGSLVGTNTIPFEAAIPDNAIPTGSIIVTPASDTVPASWGEYVRGESAVSWRVDGALGSFGAGISRCVFKFAGQTMEASGGLSGTTKPIDQSGTLTPQVILEDTRGRTAKIDGMPVVVWEYAPPVFSTISVYRSDAGRNPSNNGSYVTVSCNASCSSVNGKNKVTVRYRFKTAGGSYGSYTNITNGASNRLSGFLPTQSYQIEVSAIDSLNRSTPIEVVIPTENVAFHLRDGNNGAAFGKYSEKANTLECAWDAEFAGKVTAADIVVGGKSLLDLLHPVGAYYISDDPTEPSTLFGGTWVKVEGRFLLGAGTNHSVGDTGGEATHTLTTNEVPSHAHDDFYLRTSKLLYATNSATAGSGSTFGGFHGATGADGFKTGATGGGQPHNNMPPYYATNIWRRTA